MDPKDFLNIDPILMDRVRLVIMATLAASKKPMDFTTLLETLELSKGNLSTHIRKLEDAGLVKVRKEFIERKPRTSYSCTTQGRREMKHYLNSIEALLEGTKKK